MTQKSLSSVVAVALFLTPFQVSTPLRAQGTARPEEMAEARRWVQAKFEGVAVEPQRQIGLNVTTSYGPIGRNAHGELPLKLQDKIYKRGLYCHAPSKIIVGLSGPAKKFTALVGVSSNHMTRPGRGSIVCSVSVAGKEAFRSAVLREGMPGAAIDVDLAGAEEFVLEVGDSGDGISCDQSAWVDAKVVLADQRVVWLGDLPVRWAARGAYAAEPPFSFTYGGKSSFTLLAKWKCRRTSRKLDATRTEHTLEYRDSETGLAARCVAVAYNDFPTVEWTLYLKNTGSSATPIVSDLMAVDTQFHRGRQGEFTLHHHTGSPCSAGDYQPHATSLAPKASKRIATSGGRPTNSNMPYFNVEWPSEGVSDEGVSDEGVSDEGVIVVLGWPGQWAAEFVRDEGAGLRIRGGQELTRLTLRPGEEVRTPLVVVQFWQGDRVGSQNVWRRWMLTHNTPAPGGKPMPPILIMCTSDFYPGMRSTADGERKYIDAYVKAGAKFDYWWIDAGWYPCDNGWWKVGTWQPDPKRYPDGLRAVADYVHSRGMKLVVWFEPERVHQGTWLAENRPQWVLGGKQGGLLNLGNPEARRWLTDHVDKLITEQGIDLYRQDFNMDPLGHWRAADAPDRQGITEIRHVEGYLAYWDELRRRHPDMPIDSCASGGRRNDLETLRRAVPLLRSDYRSEPVGTQGHTYGMASWIPYHGTGVPDTSDYVVRSHWCPCLGIGRDRPTREDLDWTDYHRMLAEWRRVVPYLLGDYYPLTPYSLENSVWMAWQFDRPDLGAGMVQAFRRAESPYESARFRLRGLDPEARYKVTDLDTDESRQVGGREAMEDGLLVTASKRPQAVVLLYEKAR